MRKFLFLIVACFIIIWTSFADFWSDYKNNWYSYKWYTIHTDIESFSLPNDEYAQSIWYVPTGDDKNLVEKLNKIVRKMNNNNLEKLLWQITDVFWKIKDKRKQYLIQSILRSIQEEFYRFEIDTYIPQIDTHVDLLSISAYEMLCKVWTPEATLFENVCQEARNYAYTWKYFIWMSSLAFYIVNEKSNLWFKLDIESNSFWDRYSKNDVEYREFEYIWIEDLKISDITKINY